MKFKWKKQYWWPTLGLAGALTLFGLVYLYSTSSIQSDHQKGFHQVEKKETKKTKEKEIDLSGDYVSQARDQATIKKDGKGWKINYQTDDGAVSATFKTDWKTEGDNKVATGKMKKSDGNTDFTITVRVFKYQKKDPLMTVTMSDQNPDHEMVFANQKDFFKSNDPLDQVLDGNLSAFVGTYSNDALEKSIADSGFKLYGYSYEDYTAQRTSVFPSLYDGETGWTFWSGATHASFVINKDKQPKKRKGYFEVFFLGANATAIQGQELSLFLIPAGVQGPDGYTTQGRRILYGQTYFRDYYNEWWKAYPAPKKEKDLDVGAINSGDFSSLAGTWKNAKGAEMIIAADGSIKGQGKLTAVKDSDKTGKLPSVKMKMGEADIEIALLKIGAENPGGDASDTSRARLVLMQSSGNYPADAYFYRE